MSKLGKEGTYMSLMESLNDNRTKVQIVPSPTTKKGEKKTGERGEMQ